VSALFRFRILSCFWDSRQAAIILPHAPQVERGGLFSRVYFATDICDKQALDFMGLKNRRKTYPLRNELQKNRRQFGGLYRFVYCPHAIF
jgi:hypothetical protein